MGSWAFMLLRLIRDMREDTRTLLRAHNVAFVYTLQIFMNHNSLAPGTGEQAKSSAQHPPFRYERSL